MPDVILTPKRRAVLEAIREISSGTINRDASHRGIGRKTGMRPDLANRLCIAMEGALTERARPGGSGMVPFWRITPAAIATRREQLPTA